MANNRLYLKCKRTGQKVTLAKYYPGTGWYVNNPELVKALDEMFQRDDFGNMTWKHAEAEGVKAAGGMWDGNAHVLEYEVDQA